MKVIKTNRLYHKDSTHPILEDSSPFEIFNDIGEIKFNDKFKLN